MSDDEACSPIFVDRHGNVFLEFLRVDEEGLSADCRFVPLTHALVVVESETTFLFVHNVWRHEWELAGGVIDPGETPRQCAARELAEESGQVADSLQLEGVMKFRLEPDDRLEYGALYYTRLERRLQFTPNAEVDRIVFWDLQADIGEVAEIDRLLVDLIRHR